MCLAKNLCLAGVKTVAIYDPELVTVQDLGTQVGVVTLLVRRHNRIYFVIVLPPRWGYWKIARRRCCPSTCGTERLRASAQPRRQSWSRGFVRDGEELRGSDCGAPTIIRAYLRVCCAGRCTNGRADNAAIKDQ